MYKKARAGEIPNFTGISDPYEAPEDPELDIKTGEQTLDQSVDFVLKRMFDDGILRKNSEPRVAQTLYEQVSDEEKNALNNLPSIDVDIE